MKKTLIPLLRFIQTEVNSGIVLIVVTVIAMIIANSAWSDFYFDIFEKTKLSIDFKFWSLSKPLYYWINDGLMAIFFMLVGLEVKREILIGELSELKKAMFPVVAAIGGMVIPASIFVGFNLNDMVHINGWAIPMATDIAFALGILALLKSKAPLELKIFLSSLAIVDDIGAVLTIAVFHTSDINFGFLMIALSGFVVLLGLNKFGVRNLWIYIVLGILFVWYPLLQSGVHATIAGIFIAFTIPMRRKANAMKFITTLRNSIENFHENSTDDDINKLNDKQYNTIEDIKKCCENVSSPVQNLEHSIHSITLYGIMPLFAFANTGIKLQDFDLNALLTNNLSLGIFGGLFLGKVTGIVLFVFVFKKLNLLTIPENINWQQIFGAGFLAGIGFTMSIFITDLAFHGDELVNISKLSILIASVFSGIVGYLLINNATKADVSEIQDL